MIGTVYKSTGSWYTVKSEDGIVMECRIKGKFRIQGIKSTNPIAVGDEVRYELEHSGDETFGIISEILPRKNYIIRKSVNLSKQTHILAANIDLVLLMITLNNPTTYTSFIDRYLATSEAYDIPAVLIFNKIDTYDEEQLEALSVLSDLYSKIGYSCLHVSSKTGENVNKVMELMKGKTSIFSGHSGVGKSTLINKIEPGLELKTAEISEQHMQGQHTTTFAEMYDLKIGARIIDTPGIRGFGLVDMDDDEISDYFPELFELKSACKFNNCLHLEEPQCAVKNALEAGEIASSRYHSYVQMVTGEDGTYRVDVYES